MTVHAAKGLEFPYVFLCAMNEGVFPSRKVRTLPGMEEERRLAFVAMTRAQRALFLTEAGGRALDGAPRYPSRFILDIDQELLEYTAPPQEGLIKEAREYVSHVAARLAEEDETPPLPRATACATASFGDGTVRSIDYGRRAYLVEFDRVKTPRAIAFRAKLLRLQ